jgi:elongator complex protein 3
MMPNLPGSSPELDRESFARVWQDPDFRPDELKLYPTVVSPESELAGIWRAGGYAPYDDATLIDLTADLVGMIPEYVRLNRLYRDIPASEIIAGSTLANLREHVERAMNERGTSPVDISAREIRSRDRDPSRAVLDASEYEASGGREYFLQWIDPDDRTLWSLLRLRIPSWYFEGAAAPFAEIAGCAIIREVHTFGDQLAVGEAPNGTGQHMGFGKRLVARAEEIVREKFPGIEGVAAISGVGVRGYYAKLGYARAGEYMVKKFS